MKNSLMMAIGVSTSLFIGWQAIAIRTVRSKRRSALKGG
jgi:hypothetical protein